MNDEEVTRYWESNAEAWTRLVRAGCDIYRDNINTLSFGDGNPSAAGAANLPSPPTPPPFLPRGQQQHHRRPQDV